MEKKEKKTGRNKWKGKGKKVLCAVRVQRGKNVIREKLKKPGKKKKIKREIYVRKKRKQRYRQQ